MLEGVGQRSTQAVHTGVTRATGVCCSITSLINTPQALVPGSRQGSARAEAVNQAINTSASTPAQYVRHAEPMHAGSGAWRTTVDDVLHPVGPEPRVVYVRRRVAMVSVALVVLVGVGWLSVSMGGGAPDPQPAQAAATGAITTTAQVPGTSPVGAPSSSATSPTPTPQSTSRGAPANSVPSSAGAQAPTPIAPPVNGPQLAACSDDALTLEAQVADTSYTVGAQPVFRLLVTNAGKTACTTDLSARLQQFVVYSADGQTRIWSSNDCFSGTAPDTRTLAPAAQAVYSIQWAGTSSAVGCTAPRVPAGAGRYVVMTVLGAHQSQPVPFAIT